MISTMTLFRALRSLVATRRLASGFSTWRRMFAIVRYQLAATFDAHDSAELFAAPEAVASYEANARARRARRPLSQPTDRSAFLSRALGFDRCAGHSADNCPHCR